MGSLLPSFQDRLVAAYKGAGLLPMSTGISKLVPPAATYHEALDIAQSEVDRAVVKFGPRANDRYSTEVGSSYREKRFALIAGFESVKTTAYPDTGGTAIGLGFRFEKENAREVWEKAFGKTVDFDRAKAGTATISKAQAKALFDHDILYYEGVVDRATAGRATPLTQNQRLALVSVAYSAPKRVLDMAPALQSADDAATIDAILTKSFAPQNANLLKGRRYSEARLFASPAEADALLPAFETYDAAVYVGASGTAYVQGRPVKADAPGLDIVDVSFGGETRGGVAIPSNMFLGNVRTGKVEGVVFHHTGGPSLDGAINAGRQAGVQHGTGAQYYIDTDGSIYQYAPDDNVMSNIRPPGHKYRVDDDAITKALANGNVIGVEIVAPNSSKFTQAQMESAAALASKLQGQYGFSPDMIVGHGTIQGATLGGNKQDTEGVNVAEYARNYVNGLIPPGNISTVASELDTAPVASKSYTVQAGDNLTTVSERLGTTVDALVKANGITDPNKIKIGQTLTTASTGLLRTSAAGGVSKTRLDPIVTATGGFKPVAQTGALTAPRLDSATAFSASADLGQTAKAGTTLVPKVAPGAASTAAKTSAMFDAKQVPLAITTANKTNALFDGRAVDLTAPPPKKVVATAAKPSWLTVAGAVQAGSIGPLAGTASLVGQSAALVTPNAPVVARPAQATVAPKPVTKVPSKLAAAPVQQPGTGGTKSIFSKTGYGTPGHIASQQEVAERKAFLSQWNSD